MSPNAAARRIGIGVVLVLAALFVAVVALLSRPPVAVAPTPGPSGLPAGAVAAEVQRVVDGDTVVVTLDGRSERVRYIGIDAPELGSADDGRPPDCWGIEARDRHADLVEGRTLWLIRDQSDRDRFERLLRHAWISANGGWITVAEALVADGAAHARSYPPDTGMDRALAAAEDVARAAGEGLWGACGSG